MQKPTSISIERRIRPRIHLDAPPLVPLTSVGIGTAGCAGSSSFGTRMVDGHLVFYASPSEGNVGEDAIYGTQIHPTERIDFGGPSTLRAGNIHGTVRSVADGRIGSAVDEDPKLEEEEDDDFQVDPEFLRLCCERIARVI